MELACIGGSTPEGMGEGFFQRPDNAVRHENDEEGQQMP
jgi:hypothetical protein